MLKLEIARVRIVVGCSQRMIASHLDPSYASFVEPWVEGSCAPELRVELVTGPLPSLGGAVKVFDAAPTWSLWRRGDSEFIVFANARGPEPLWIAESRPSPGALTVHCSEALLVPFSKGFAEDSLASQAAKLPGTATEVGNEFHRPGLGEAAGKTAVHNPISYPLDQLLLMRHLARHRGLVLHAGGVALGGRALLFAGRSGAGKSTLAGCLERSPCTRLSDERMVVRELEGEFMAFGTPWSGTGGIAMNAGAPLAAVLLVARGTQDEVVPLSRSEALRRLLPLASVPWFSAAEAELALDSTGALLERVPAFELRFRPTPAVQQTIEALVASL